jgi:transglutaminase-like putative cysteine protease
MFSNITKFLMIIAFLSFSTLAFSQESHTVDFEPEGVGQDWEWTVDQNDDDPDLTFIANPDPTSGNTSPTVAQFTARVAGNPWALFFTNDNGQFEFDANNSMVKIMVHKSRVSPVGIKFEGALGSSPELKVENTVTGEWEELTFDFSSEIGKSYSRIVIIPDFLERDEENIVYLDNLILPKGVEVEVSEPEVAAPTPEDDQAEVISIFSDAYEDLAGTDLDPSWGQSTEVTETEIEGNATLLYETLNYQGIQIDGSIDLDAQGMNYLHLDFWTPNATMLAVSLIKLADASPKEAKYDLTITNNEWVSIDIPLNHYEGLGLTLEDIHQLKFDGNGTIYLDNIYFKVGEPVVGSPTHTVDFEPNGIGQDWEWTVEENDDNPALEFITNPDQSGGNTSPTVAKFTARAAGNPWALFYTSDDGEFTFDAENSMVKIMVHKSRVSDVGIKFEGAAGASPELRVANTVTGEWEELTFDFSSEIGKSFARIVIIPDFAERAEENLVYIDNIVLPDGEVVEGNEPLTAAPNPMTPATDVISIFSDAYDNLPDTDLNPNWGQSTSVSEMMIEDNNTLKYEFLNYQGTQLASAQDLSEMSHLHIDYWTANSTALSISLIKLADASPKEFKYDITVTSDQWVSIDIPLSHYTENGLTLDDIHQLKVEGNGTLFFDNIYFFKESASVRTVQNDNALFTLEQNYPNPFNASTKIRFSVKESNNVELKVFDSFGQEIQTLRNEFMPNGDYQVDFNSHSLSSGNYIISLKVGNLTSTRTMSIVK